MLRQSSSLLRSLSGYISRQNAPSVCARTMSSLADYKYETLNVSSPNEYVYQVEINRPEKLNAMNRAFWREMVECFNQIDGDKDCRAIVVTGSGRLFTAGIDIQDLAGVLMGNDEEDVGRKAFNLIKGTIPQFQESFTSIEKCTKPVIAAVHNACIGGGIDLITACDIRYCTSDAWFQVKEVDVGLAADVGTLQRLPKVVGNDSLVRELCYTARKMYAQEALQFGLVSRIFENKEDMVKSAIELATDISSKSPVAVQGTKVNLVYSRDHSVREGLEYVAQWNMSMLQSEDLIKAAMASMQKQKAKFSKL